MKGSINMTEAVVFVAYFVVVLAVGIHFFFTGIKEKKDGEKEYFLGGRNMNGWVAALSAGASDMSAWVLMGLPGSIYLAGIGQVWISVGLLIGTILAWIFVAPRLRRFSIAAGDSITIPEFLTNRFGSKKNTLRIVCALIFLFAYAIYSASSISACGTLFHTVLGMNELTAMIIATVVILVYTFLGGFNAVCWTDFFQGMLMLIALMAAPIVMVCQMKSPDFVAASEPNLTAGYYNILSSGKFDWNSVSDIISGLGWGLGYFGMPHIIIRYMSIKSEKEMKKSRVIGIFWTTLILICASAVALIGRQYLGDSLIATGEHSLLFVTVVRKIFSGSLSIIGGILLSAIVAAAMSTADSQLLAASSAFSSDIYKTTIRKEAKDKEMLWAGRIAVAVISVIALLIAVSPNCKGIMALVECAWGAFGAAFGPVIILALFWKRFTYKGAVAGIIAGFVVDLGWYVFLTDSFIYDTCLFDTNIYEIVPGFIVGLIAAVVFSLCDNEPSEEVKALFDAGREETKD